MCTLHDPRCTCRDAATCTAFFEAWNRRDMLAAIDLFAEDVVYEDTVYPEVFLGREQLRFHLLRVADAPPLELRLLLLSLEARFLCVLG